MNLNTNSLICRSYLRNKFPFSAAKKFYSKNAIDKRKNSGWYTPEHYMPQDLCRFVRNYLALVGRSLLIGSILGFFALSVLITLYSLIFWDSALHQSVFFPAGIVVLVLSSMAAFLTASAMLMDKIIRYRYKKNKNKEPTKPNIFVEYYKAWKGKYCPIIRYIDKDN